jgi:hypothetical protein
MEQNNTPTSFLEVFLSKLKEQSFTIVLMLEIFTLKRHWK